MNKTNELQLLLNPEDLKTRKWWLRALIADVLLSSSLGAIVLSSNTHHLIWMIIYQVTASLLRFYVIYHCAYKKFGNKWMIFDLAAFSLFYVGRFWVNASYLVTNPYSLLLLVIYAVFAWYFVMSLKLCRLNKKIKKQYIPLIQEKASHG